jgi:hypothetical protein
LAFGGLVALLLTATPLSGQNADQAAATRTTRLDQRARFEAFQLGSDQGVDLDGELTEAAWARAQAITDFRQKDPVENADPSEPTEVRVMFDEDNLYIGAILYDSDPSGILGYQKRRDAPLSTDDRFMFILDTFLDSRTGYFFETNPVGLLGDGLISSGGGGRGGGGGFGVNKSWDGIWDVRTARRPDGWSVEVRIPFRTLNFDPRLDQWGINFQRTIRRRREEIQWSGYRRNQPLTQPVHAGLVTGLQGLSQGVGLEIKPYALGSWVNEPFREDPTDYPAEIGGDIQYNITPSLRAGVSINTDFAEVEVDQRRVNLSRFPISYPEQRDFFLEGSSVYSFAPRSGPQPYFSRRIGINQGEQIPIRWGARLGGQAGRYEMGFLHMNTAEHPVTPREDFTVARLKRNFLAQSYLGVIATRRGTHADSTGFSPTDKYTLGVDTNLATATLFGNKNLQFEAFYVWNTEPDPDEEDPDLVYSTQELSAWGFRFNFPNDVYEAHLSYREFGDFYTPAVGFVRRNDFRRVEPRIGWNPRTDRISWLRRLEFGLQYRYLEGLKSGIKEEEQWQFEFLGLAFESGDRIEYTATSTYEFLTRDFEIWPGIIVEAGGYTVWLNRISGGTAGQRPVSIRGRGSWGGFWDGNIRNVGAEVTARPMSGLNFSAGYEINDVKLPDGSFQTNLVRASANWNATPLIAFTGNIQYDDISEIVGLFAKLHWIVQPGNDLFFVFTHNWIGNEALDPEDRPNGLTNGFSTLSRGATIKANYTFRF